MAKFQTKVTKARFNISGLDSQQMLRLAEAHRASVHDRIVRGLTVYDQAAPPLKGLDRTNGYGTRKARRAPPAIRNWRYTGRTLRSMKVLTTTDNKAIIGFTDGLANMRAFFNNRRSLQFGTSPRDRQNMINEYHRLKQRKRLAA